MKFLVLTFLVINLYAVNVELTLDRFAAFVASSNKINLLIDDSIKSDKITFFIEDTNKKDIYLSVFKKMLEAKNLYLREDKENKFFYILSKDKAFPKVYQTIKLNGINYEDLKNSLDLSQIKHKYNKATNSIIVYANNIEISKIRNLIRLNDKVPQQFRLKMTIVETNLNDIKERGTNIQAFTQSLQGETKYFLQLLSMPFQTDQNTFNDDSTKNGIYSVLRYLNDNGYSKIVSSPSLTVQSGQPIYFSAVQNIPYKTASSNTNGASQTNTETIQYMDVGLKINLLPKVVNDTVFCNLSFTMETLLSKSSLTPTISKRELKNNFQLKRGEVLVLSGIQYTQEDDTEYGIPILMDIPILEYVFKYTSKEIINRSLTITIEVL